MSRTSVSPFQHGNSWWARFPVQHGNGRQRTLGTSDLATATVLCAMLVSLRAQHEWYLLDRLADGTASLSQAYKAWSGPGVANYVQSLRAGPTSIDLEPYVGKWLAQMEKNQVPDVETRKIYKRHVRKLIPADSKDTATGVVTHHPFPSSDLTKTNISRFLEGLEDVGVTNRYRASLSRFCEYLVGHHAAGAFVPVNVALEVKAQPKRKGRVRWLDQTQSQKLIAAIEDDEARAWSALAIATGMEAGAVACLRHRDINLKKFSAHAHGTKREHRDRTCTVPPHFDWAWKIFTDWYTPGQPGDKVFGMKRDLAYRRLKAACVTAGVEDFVMHDWRHCFAVLCLQAEDPVIEPVAISQQLGHKNVQMLWDVYGQYRAKSTAMRPKPVAKAKRPKRKP